MAVGPPLAFIYAESDCRDQYLSIIRKKSSAGFSVDVCGVLLFANTTRIFFWLGERFELPLLIQSILMIIAQLALLWVCVRYKPSSDYEALSTLPTASEPSGLEPMVSRKFWNWDNYGTYIEALAAFIAFQSMAFLLLYRWRTYIEILGFVALGLESTLPLPQLITNFRRKSLEGFRWTVLVGWFGGDSFKLLYFLLKKAPVQFIACGAFQLSVDILIVGQAFLYRNN
ncbi:hypothetical protein BT69DRAFT_1311854 [Atractiella rhizophila]|nr:hypothetical protein BT69DRAFT_1311854 [Atractiella rhizophila]